jgi:hypothetical protein
MTMMERHAPRPIRGSWLPQFHPLNGMPFCPHIAGNPAERQPDSGLPADFISF